MASLPAGDFETKVAIDESWDENYGAGGVANGPNIPFSVPTGGAEVCFSFNASSHMLTIESPCATNHAPTAVGDAYGANQGNQLSVPVAGGVLANDSDPDAGTTLTAVLESGPSHGTLALATDGSFVYTPVAVYSGSDSFSYRASDGSLASNLVTVTINVASLSTIINSQPKLTSGQKASLNNKLAAAATLFGQGKLNPACGKLSEFISQVSGLMPTKLSASTATVLINGANARKTYYGCPA